MLSSSLSKEISSYLNRNRLHIKRKQASENTLIYRYNEVWKHFFLLDFILCNVFSGAALMSQRSGTASRELQLKHIMSQVFTKWKVYHEVVGWHFEEKKIFRGNKFQEWKLGMKDLHYIEKLEKKGRGTQEWDGPTGSTSTGSKFPLL